MKWKVTRIAAGSEVFVEIDVPDQVRMRKPSVGEPFQLKARNSQADSKKVPSNAGWNVLNCMFVGDGKSLKVENKIVRLSLKPMALKKGNYRLRIAAGGICADEVRNISVVRPVAPVQNNSLLANGNIKSPMTGKAIKVLVKLGDKVEEGDVIVIVEAMKMENQIRSECSGQVKSISVQEGESVSVDQLLAVVEVEPLQAKKNG